jgi:hypothetical protein
LEINGGRGQEKNLIALLGKNELVPAGLAIHKNGRIFLACVGDLKTGGVERYGQNCELQTGSRNNFCSL